MELLANLPAGYEHLTPEMCLACKGAKGLCGMPCLLLSRIDNRLPQLRITSQDLQGPSPPGLFVGRHGYPNVGYGPLLAPVDLPDATLRRMDDPADWTSGSIGDVLGLRSALLRTVHRAPVRDARRPTAFLRATQELAMGARPTETEVHLTRRPNLELTARVGDVAAPMGPSLEADRARLTENVRVLRPVERAVGDGAARASDTAWELYRAGVGTQHVERLLSVGLLGTTRQRRLVPTRWSITATDDMLGKRLIPAVMDRPTIDRVEAYHASVHGNRFHVLLLPQVWSFDMVEVWLKGAMWALEDSRFIQDGEDWRGRKGYASNITGAYYAARLGVLEHLGARRRQAAAFVYREITPDYWAPLGVWVIREGVRRAMASVPKGFETTSAAIAATERETLRRDWWRASPLLTGRFHQRRLQEFA